MDHPRAKVDKPNNTSKWRVMFTMADTLLLDRKEDAEIVTDMINKAYDRGRSDLQRELRGLLNVDRATDA